MVVSADHGQGSKTWNWTVDTTDPVFFYCNAIGSCHPNGMVGVINPNELVSLEKQKQAAIKAPFQLAPGEPWPAEGVKPGAETASVTGLNQPTTTALNGNTGHSDHHSLSGGAIAGIVIGGVVVLALAAALFYFIGRSKTYKDMWKGHKSETAGNASAAGDNIGPWTPAPAMGSGHHPNRMSNMTQYSQAPSDATFVGYNRQTGAPEFANEAPISEHGAYTYAPASAQGSPQPPQSGFTSTQQKRETFELPAETPKPLQPPKAHEKP
jgi:hypothetical protein